MAATIKDIARITGLGLATISKYLNGGHVLDKNRKAIERAMADLNYHVNEFGRNLKTGHSGTVGVVIPELNVQFSAEIISAMEDVLRQHGLGVIVCDCRTNEEREADAIEFLLSKRVDGLINMPVCQTSKNLKPAIARGIPILLIDRQLRDVQLDSVIIDNIRASEDACRHLIEKGHRRIGLIAGPQDAFTARQRVLGYYQSLIACGLKPEESLIAYGDFTSDSGYAQTTELLHRCLDVSALLVANYDMTLGALMALHDMNLRLGEDVSVIGIDNMQLSCLVRPRLTVIEQPLKSIGAEAAELMLKRLQQEPGQAANPVTISLTATLRPGESVKELN